MALPQQFLDELRARLTLSTMIGRRVKLTRAGREYKACCPFHKEKTPSFWVNDEKGFFHCFGCGAHGDVITFEMQSTGLSFPEAVEKLAVEAGLEVPKASPREREEARQRASLQEVVEAACTFFEKQLRLAAGREGHEYLLRRGLDEDTIRRFRLGWAPGGGALKGALAREGIDEAQMVDAGLLKRGDDGRLYEYFRDRVMFPITDRRGRVIAFGGRILGDGQPKYLNSPDTPLFHKGQVLYGLAQAREPASKANEVVVAEGYMDVIALARAGFPQSVAPLGTALTEAQIEELWKLADEPTLCFDGDAAGQRAAARAAERALAVLKPGKSLRFALVEGGKDPDDLIQAHGPAAMRAVLDKARTLLDVLWDNTVAGRNIDTPERRAALEKDFEDLAGRIADRSVQSHYRRAFRDRQFALFRPPRREWKSGGRAGGTGGRGQAGPQRRSGGGQAPWMPPPPPPPRPRDNDAVKDLRRRVLLATLIAHPGLIDIVGERLGALDYPVGSLDKLKGAVLMLLGREPYLDFEGLKDHLRTIGLGEELDSLLSSDAVLQTGFCRSDIDIRTAERGWEDAYGFFLREEQKADRKRVVARLSEQPDDETFNVLRMMKQDSGQGADE